MTAQKWPFPNNNLCCLCTFESNLQTFVDTSFIASHIYFPVSITKQPCSEGCLQAEAKGKEPEGPAVQKVTSGCFSCQRQPLLPKLLASPAPSCRHVSTASKFSRKNLPRETAKQNKQAEVLWDTEVTLNGVL